MTTPTDNQNLVKTRELNWKELVMKQWGKDWAKPEPAYEFSNGRKFHDPKNGGPYQR
jgi:hypothetical protein